MVDRIIHRACWAKWSIFGFAALLSGAALMASPDKNGCVRTVLGVGRAMIDTSRAKINTALVDRIHRKFGFQRKDLDAFESWRGSAPDKAWVGMRTVHMGDVRMALPFDSGQELGFEVRPTPGVDHDEIYKALNSAKIITTQNYPKWKRPTKGFQWNMTGQELKPGIVIKVVANQPASIFFIQKALEILDKKKAERYSIEYEAQLKRERRAAIGQGQRP